MLTRRHRSETALLVEIRNRTAIDWQFTRKQARRELHYTITRSRL